MSFREFSFQSEYRTILNDVTRDFFVPALSQAVLYKRSVGYFSSGALVSFSRGICNLVKNNGKIQMIASPCLSEQDFEAIKQGYDKRKKISENILSSLMDEDNEIYKKRLDLVANLISQKIMDIKIAMVEEGDSLGIYHEKVGIIVDAEGNRIAFSGSNNETDNALHQNYESFDVFCEWKSLDAAERVENKEKMFDAMWGKEIKKIIVLDFPELKEEIVKKYKQTNFLNLDIDKEEFQFNMCEEIVKGPKLPENIQLYDYQIRAIDTWEKAGYKGIFDMATGTGKTYTGLGAMCRLASAVKNEVAVIILCPYQHLVDQWAEDIRQVWNNPIIGYSSSPQKKWFEKLKIMIQQQRFLEDKPFFCFVSTIETFATERVQKLINEIQKDILLIVDEAHNIGTNRKQSLLDNRFKYRLALSATLERHGDEEGTRFLYDYFGEVCIEYSLKEAIISGKLTPYNYHPIIVSLTDEERRAYIELSIKIGKEFNKKKRNEDIIKILSMKRARLVAGAIGKIDALKKAIMPFKSDYNLLVYCGATAIEVEDKRLEADQEFEESNKIVVRQIAAVTSLLGNDLGMKVHKFTADESSKDRKIIKDWFKNKTIQAIVAIRCLDEGVNIPGINKAFILASSTNPKEYIQRRGRVLRLSEGKDVADIYDFITLPIPVDKIDFLSEDEKKMTTSLVKKEITRWREFEYLAINGGDSINLRQEIETEYSSLWDSERDECYGE